jgi:hypothetical protein
MLCCTSNGTRTAWCACRPGHHQRAPCVPTAPTPSPTHRAPPALPGRTACSASALCVPRAHTSECRFVPPACSVARRWLNFRQSRTAVLYFLDPGSQCCLLRALTLQGFLVAGTLRIRPPATHVALASTAASRAPDCLPARGCAPPVISVPWAPRGRRHAPRANSLRASMLVVLFSFVLGLPCSLLLVTVGSVVS